MSPDPNQNPPSSGDEPTGPKILLVDDDPSVRDVYALGLRAAGYQVESAKSGRSIRQRLHQDDVDLLIVDIIMDDVDGFEVLSEIRKFNPDFSVLAISGTSQYPEISESLGCSHTLLKPFTVPQLVSVVEAALGAGPERPQ